MQQVRQALQLNRQNSLLSQSESQKVELYFSARNLADLDLVSVTDSFIKVFLQQTNRPSKLVLQSKIYWNDLNPDYAENVITQFFFEVRQKIIVQVYHEASPPELIGTVQSTIGEIFGCKNNGIHKKIVDKKNNERGQLIIRLETLQNQNNKIVNFNVSCNSLHCGSSFLCFGNNQCLFRIYKLKGPHQYLIYESQMMSGSESRFKTVKIREKKFCNDNVELSIVFRFYKHSQIAAPIFIGETKTNKSMIENGTLNYEILGKSSKNKGNFTIENYKITKKDKFPDFLAAGMQMALQISIDFTGSNGDPKNKTSLHYTSQKVKSQYEQALEETCNIVMDYDTDKLVPTYGFGAKLKGSSSVNHHFPLNGNDGDPNLLQVDGIMQGYRQCMKNLQLSGPTNFAPLLKERMETCKQMKKQQKQYMILMILTDGAIHDINKVKDMLIQCSRLPLSIIIIGIGNGPWQAMNELDDDDCQMTDKNGNKTQRDLVQFVEFNSFKGDGVLLARQVLQELPRQVQQYHQLCGIKADEYKKT